MNKIFPAARYAAIIAAALLAFACHTAKHSADNQPYTGETEQTETATGAFSLQTVAETVPAWTDVTISGKLTINSGKSSISSPVILKMVNDKMISISIRPILGIEMGKIYITNDSLVAVDKYHKTYFTENIASLVGFDLDVASLQALFLSRPFQPGEGPITDKNRKKFNATNPDTDGNWNIAPKKQPDAFSYNFDMNGNNVSSFNLVVATNSAYLPFAANFHAFRLSTKGIFASEINLELPLGDSNMQTRLSYTKDFSWDTGLTDNIQVPSNARRMSLPDFIKLLTQQ